MSRMWTLETGSCVIHEGSDKRNNLIVNSAYRALASHGKQRYAAPLKNTPQRRACLPSAQSGEPQNMPAPMWASKCGAESEVVKSYHSKCQTYTSHSEMVDLVRSHRSQAAHPTTCPCVRSGIVETLNRNVAPSASLAIFLPADAGDSPPGRHARTWRFSEPVTLPFDWSESGPSFQH